MAAWVTAGLGQTSPSDQAGVTAAPARAARPAAAGGMQQELRTVWHCQLDLHSAAWPAQGGTWGGEGKRGGTSEV